MDRILLRGMGTLVRYGRGTTDEHEWTLMAWVLSDSVCVG